jgi:glycine/D-amino acid oxidase-like deaminating enzyme
VTPPRVAVVGAGAFGGWIALWLRRLGAEVTLWEAWEPGHPRASSGDETRVLRGMYGADRIYLHWVARALEIWRDAERAGRQSFYRRTGVLWMFPNGADDAYARSALPLLAEIGWRVQELDAREVTARFPLISTADVASAFFEQEGGALAARRSCRWVADEFEHLGGVLRCGWVPAGPIAAGRMSPPEGSAADLIVYACGPWLPVVFPALLGGVIVPSRQEVFVFGTPAASGGAFEQLPVWIELGERSFYGIPFNEGHGFKIADDTRGEVFDPTGGDRSPSVAGLGRARAYLESRFPGLAGAPLIESRVCQYENSPDGHFVIDRHPEADNVWFVGGGSGHGFKLAPALGEEVARRLLADDSPPAPFTLARLRDRGTARTTQFTTGGHAGSS